MAVASVLVSVRRSENGSRRAREAAFYQLGHLHSNAVGDYFRVSIDWDIMLRNYLNERFCCDTICSNRMRSNGGHNRQHTANC